MLNALTSFRFLAALMVLIFHVGLMKNYQLGTAGVQFFFVLSGFILAYNYQLKFNELNKKTIFGFYRARIAKIYPTHVLTFLIAAPLVILYFNPDGLYLIKLLFMSMINLLLIQSFFPSSGTYFNFNGVSWTLSVEFFFYLTFPFIMYCFNKLDVNKKMVKYLFIFGCLWLILFFMNASVDENNKLLIWLLHIFPVTRLFEFSVGVLLGIYFTSDKKREFKSNFRVFTFLEMLCLILFIFALLLSVNLDVGIVRGVYFVPIWCLLIYIFAFESGFFSKVLGNKSFVFLGEISFSFYMIHQLVIRYLEFLNLIWYINVVISSVLSLVLSIVMYRFYEEPFRKLIRFGRSKRAKLEKNREIA